MITHLRILAVAVLLALAPARVTKADPAIPSPNTYDLVFIGDSITHGAGTAQPATQAAPVVCGQLLQKLLPGASIFVCNEGYVGYTTLGISRQMRGIEKAIAPFLAAHPGRLVFSIMLGTNDSANSGPGGSPASPADYRANLESIVDEILGLHPGAIVLIQRPIWYSPNTIKKGADYGGAAASNRLKSYFPEIPALVADYAASHPNQVFEGDTRAYDSFAANYQTDLSPEHGLDGTFYLHPNASGAASLAEFWADAIAPHLTH